VLLSRELQLYVTTERRQCGLDARKLRRVMRIENAARFLLSRWIFQPLAYPDHLWSYLVMKQVGIAELKSKLSEFLRIVQGGESIAVLDRNRAVAHIVPILERPGLRIRKPASDSPKPNKVSLPKPMHRKFDVLELLLEERQSQR
jgi:antitoxin (DNA-binding transcriptional repressor) of toxin-antitoxin stability system